MNDTDIKTLGERGERLRDLLAGALPQWRVAAALSSQERAARAGVTRLPEARLILVESSPARPLLWRVELAQGDPAGEDARRAGPHGLLYAREAIGAAIAQEGACLALARARERGATSLANTWEILLEEAWTPSGAVRQAFFLPGAVVATLSSQVPAGESTLPTTEPVALPPDSPVGAVDNGGMVGLGVVAGTDPVLVTSLPAPRPIEAGGQVVSLNPLVTLPEAAGEEEHWDAARWRHAGIDLEGAPRVAAFATPHGEVELRLYPCPPAAWESIRATLESGGEAGQLLLLRRGQGLVSATPLSASWSAAEGMHLLCRIHPHHEISWEENP